jgi:hypothetical protein
MKPPPVGLHDQLPHSDLGRCIQCRCWLYYQRTDDGYPRHFFFCRRCGRRYAAWEMNWTPGGKQPDD